MISIVIPAYNEENAIADTIHRCKNILKTFGSDQSEVIVVDDCSKDNTLQIAQQHAHKVLKHPHNIGYGRSIKDGIVAAKNDIIVITDADGTYPIESIPALITEYSKGFDMVVGARQGANYDESFSKKILRLFLKWLVEFTAGRKIDDINSGLRVFSRTTILDFHNTLCDTFSLTTSLTLAYMMTGKFVKYIPIEYHKRVGKTKVKLFQDSLRTLQYITEAILYYNPIKIFIAFSVFLIFLSFCCFGISLIWYLTSTFFLGIGLLLLSVLVFGMGLIAVLLKQIMHKSVR